MITNIVRAMRLPFLGASHLPFIFGSLISYPKFNFLNFILGMICVSGTHLGANLLNDYCDSKSGADWHDRNFYNFFGGSKLIQQGVFPEKFYLAMSICFFLAAVSAVSTLGFILKSFFIVAIYSVILALSISYTAVPLRLSYRYLGEIAIFFLFGPALVMGGYFIQTGIFPTVKGFLMSLPFGFLTAAILFANEIPDFKEDKLSGKLTLVGIMGPGKAYGFYLLLVFFAFAAIILDVLSGYLKPLALFSLVLIFLSFRASAVLKKNFNDKNKLMESSKMTIALQGLTGIILILGLFL